MAYADTREFLSQNKPAIARRNMRAALMEHLQAARKSLFAPGFDPTKLSRAEREEAGIMDCEVDWYRAWHAPLIK